MMRSTFAALLLVLLPTAVGFWLGLVMAVLFAGHILLWVWAFIRWPIEIKGGPPHEMRPVVR